MQHSETITKISAALLISQKNTGAAKKDAVNPFFHSKYADLGAVMEACKDALNNAGITVLQPVCGDVVKTLLVHESGEWISSEGTPIVCGKQNDPQSQGSAITYARRYDLQSLLFIPAGDDDANAAMPEKTVQPVQKPASGLIKKCQVHGITMAGAISKRTGNEYWSHIVGKELCFGEGTNSEKAANYELSSHEVTQDIPF